MRALVLLLAACSFPRPPDVPGDAGGPPGDVAVTGFRFTKALNPKLQHDIVATISGTSIDATAFGIDASSLIGTFESAATDIEVDGAVQHSGSTPQSFTNPVTYTVHGANGATAVYTATMHVRDLTNVMLVATGGSNFDALTVGDLDRDGLADLVFAVGKTMTIEINTTQTRGSPTFRTTTITSPSTISALALADLDGDGRLDLLVATTDATTALLVYPNVTPQHGAIAFGIAIPIPFTGPLSAIAVGDLNDDGLPDLVATNSASGMVIIAMHEPGGGISFQPAALFPCGMDPVAVAIAILTVGGEPSILVSANGSNELQILDNLTAPGSSPFDTAATEHLPAGKAPEQIAIADFDGDHLPDLAITSPDAAVVLVSYSSIEHTVTVTASSATNGIVALDLDLDGRPDAIAAVAEGGFQPFVNTGGASLLPARASSATTGESGYTLYSADFDGDGLPDFATIFYDQLGIALMTSN